MQQPFRVPKKEVQEFFSPRLHLVENLAKERASMRANFCPICDKSLSAAYSEPSLDLPKSVRHESVKTKGSNP